MAIAFIKRQYDVGKRGKAVTIALSAVKQWLVSHSMDVSFMEAPSVQQALKATRYTQPELRIETQRIHNTALIPISADFLDPFRNTYWSDNWSDREAIDRAAIYIATVLCYDLSSRIGTVTKAERGSIIALEPIKCIYRWIYFCGGRGSTNRTSCSSYQVYRRNHPRGNTTPHAKRLDKVRDNCLA